MARTGRPRKWDELDMPSKLPIVSAWLRNGATMEQVAENLGVSHNTVYEWKHDYPEFADACKTNREIADLMVENALFQNAIGYDYEEETATPSGLVVKVKKHQGPQNAAAIFWLKNRKPNEWRDKQQLEHSGGVALSGTVTFQHLSDEELEAELAKHRAAMKGDK